jgi:hypothetical protein
VVGSEEGLGGDRRLIDRMPGLGSDGQRARGGSGNVGSRGVWVDSLEGRHSRPFVGRRLAKRRYRIAAKVYVAICEELFRAMTQPKGNWQRGEMLETVWGRGQAEEGQIRFRQRQGLGRARI